MDGYYGAYFYSKSKNVSDTLLLRNQSFVGDGRKGFTMNQLWKEYSGYIDTKTEEGQSRFEHDTQLLLRDLGVKKTGSISEIRDLLKTKLSDIGL